MIDVLAIGDVTEDVFIEVSNAASLHCDSLHHCHLDFDFGTKIAIERVDKLIGGNAGNMAIGSSRLGLHSALYAQVGADSSGKSIQASLRKDHVSTAYFSLNSKQKTNYSVVLHYKGERTILVHHEPRAYQLPKFSAARFVYLTSMAKGSEKIFPSLLSYIKKNKVKLGFNPGTHQLNLGLEKLKPLLKETNILFLNVEEAQFLLKVKTRKISDLLEKLSKVGPSIVVITDGDQGAYSYDGKIFLFCPIYVVPAIERTGCGDAFATGFLSALLHDQNTSEAMRWGTINSASVLQKIGPQEGLLHLSFLKKILQANPNFKVQKWSENEKEIAKRAYQPLTFRRF